MGRLALSLRTLPGLVLASSGADASSSVAPGLMRGEARGPNVLLLDDPTASIDIGSRRDLLGHVRRFADEGGAVVVVSSELEDLSRIADRIVVLAHGAVSQVLDRAEGDVLSEANLLAAIHQETEAIA